MSEKLHKRSIAVRLMPHEWRRAYRVAAEMGLANEGRAMPISAFVRYAVKCACDGWEAGCEEYQSRIAAIDVAKLVEGE